MQPKSSKFFAKVWREWLIKAQTVSAAQNKIDHVVKHPELELYHIKDDPWELNNLANNPEYAQKVEEMHAQLQAEMKNLGDTFSTIDPKAAKRANKGKPERLKGTESTETPELTDKQKKREARKQARQMGKEEQAK